MRRDFTINAMAYSVSSETLVDLYKGQEDLNTSVIHTVGSPDERFSEDALRMLRAIRLASELGFEIHSEKAQSE